MVGTTNIDGVQERLARPVKLVIKVSRDKKENPDKTDKTEMTVDRENLESRVLKVRELSNSSQISVNIDLEG